MKEIYFKGSKIFEFNDDSAIQLVGNNNYLIRTISDIYYKIFSGYRFSDIDIEAMNGYYPEVRENGKALKKNDILVIKLSDMEDVREQLTIKRNSILVKHILSLSSDLLINQAMEKVDKSLVELSICIDNLIEEKLPITEMSIKTGISDVNLDKIIKNFIDINFVSLDDERVPLWLSKDLQVIDLFINMIELILEEGKKTRIIIDRLDSRMEIGVYKELVDRLFNLAGKYSSFGIWIIPSNEKGVFVDYRIFDNTYILNDDIIKLGDFDITYESICRNYPDNIIPEEQEVLRSLLQLLPFHTSEKKYPATKEIIIMSIFLELLGEEKDIGIRKDHLSKLEYNFLTSSKQ